VPESIFSSPRTSLAGLSVVELVPLVWAGHGAASPGPFGIVHILGDALHLLTSAFWPGALAPLAAVLFFMLKSSQVEAIVLAAPVVRRFLRKQSDRSGRYGTYRAVKWHFHGRKFSGTPDKHLRLGTSL
jgi:hypothetical protein